MKLEHDILDRLAPTDGWKPDWTDVLDRAEAPTRRPFHFVAGRRIAVAFVAVAVLLIPVIALGADNGWWFMNAEGNAVPTFRSPTVVAEGSWNGHPWQLVAVASSKLGLCRTVTPPGKQVQPGISMSCGSMAGYVGASHPGNTAKRTVDAEYAAARLSAYPPFVSGAVVAGATRVEIRFENGDVVRLPTIAAPAPYEKIRFFVSALSEREIESNPASVTGYDDSGNVVACSSDRETYAGYSPLSACE